MDDNRAQVWQSLTRYYYVGNGVCNSIHLFEQPEETHSYKAHTHEYDLLDGENGGRPDAESESAAISRSFRPKV